MQMAAENQSAGAASHQERGWHAIHWQAANQEVKRLQVRIVKAQQQGKWGKVKALQHLLTHSFSGKALAVKRVTENQGKRTPGVDGEIWKTPQKKAEAIETLTQRGYHPQPLRRIYIPKSNGSKRPLSIPTMKDRAMQALYLLALDPIAEIQADPNSYGFRKERSTADAIDQCHTVLSNRAGAEWILEGDIKACFDKISHTWLEAHIPMEKSILQKWLKAGFIEKRVLKPTEEGTPQGGICSPVIANLALDGLEAKLTVSQLDELVWQDLCHLVADPINLARALRRAQGGDWLPQERQAQREHYRKAVAALTAQMERLTEAYLDGIFPREEYRQRRQDLEQRLMALEQQYRLTEAQIHQQMEISGMCDALTSFCQRVQAGLAEATFEQKRQLVELLIDRVIVTMDEVEIRYVIPTSPQSEHLRFCHLHTDYFAEN
jgi:group II intron reverse transcriptase/maturase